MKKKWIFLFFLVALFHESFGEDNQDKITAYVSFEDEKIWFRSFSKDILFIALTGSHIDASKLLDSKNNLNFIPRTNGWIWYMSIPKNKPHFNNGITIYNFDKLEKIMSSNKQLDLGGIYLFKLNKEGKMNGPLNTATGVLRKVGTHDLDKSKFTVIPLQQ